MPRGNKSKGRSRAKRRQAHGESQDVQAAQPTAEKEAASLPLEQGEPPSSPDVCTPQESQEASSPGCPELEVVCTGYGLGAEGSDVGAEGSDASAEGSDAGAEVSDAGAEGSLVVTEEKHANAYQEAAAIALRRRDPLSRKVSVLLQFILEKYQNNEQPMQADMLKLLSRKYKEHFPKILKKATEQLELVYGLELKVDSPHTQSYAIVSKLPIPPGENPNTRRELPKTGLVLALLGVIFTKGNRATEEEVWEFLGVLGIQPGKKHLIFGEPHQLVTKDLVEQKYLEYRRVPYSDPPSYEFLWGPRAYSETTKMKVLEIVAKINDTVPSSFPHLYEEALREEATRAGGRAEALGYRVVKTRIPSQPPSSSSPHK